MDAKELNIGDLVYCRSIGGRHAKVTENYAQLQPPFKRMVRLFSDRLTWCVPIDEVEPIPLTEEILKLNGFDETKDDYGNPSLRLNGTDDVSDYSGFCYIDWTPKGVGRRNHMYDGFLSMLMNFGSIHRPCRYVHELQHALRLCGLNELADNFKVH